MNFPPPSYFHKVVTRQDWEAADRSDCGYKEFGAAFPMSYPEHKQIVKMYKEYLKRGNKRV